MSDISLQDLLILAVAAFLIFKYGRGGSTAQEDEAAPFCVCLHHAVRHPAGPCTEQVPAPSRWVLGEGGERTPVEWVLAPCDCQRYEGPPLPLPDKAPDRAW